jgi:hypothetical protein
MKQTVNIIRIKGTKKIPDYIQIRDENFTLIAYFRLNNPTRALKRLNLLDRQEEILAIASKLPYGVMHRIEF